MNGVPVEMKERPNRQNGSASRGVRRSLGVRRTRGQSLAIRGQPPGLGQAQRALEERIEALDVKTRRQEESLEKLAERVRVLEEMVAERVGRVQVLEHQAREKKAPLGSAGCGGSECQYQ